jgi:nitrilase
MNHGEPFTVAAVQAAPVFLDRMATLEKACDLIAKAGREGARLVVFPEAFIPAYPDWVWTVPGGRRSLLDQLYATLAENSVAIPDTTTRRLGQAAKEAGVYVAMGVNERNQEASNASLYNTLVYLDPAGEILGKHRKLIPTSGERTVWAQGDGSTLEAYDTALGTLGGLLCWENYMPLARQAMYAWGTQIYVAPTWDQSDVWLASLQHIAKEGGMYVIGVCQALHLDHIPDRFAFKELYREGTQWINRGHSCIVNPRGQVIAGPVDEREEILYAEVDRRQITAAKRMFDVAGHYARPDVFGFTLDRGPNPILRTIDSSGG